MGLVWCNVPEPIWQYCDKFKFLNSGLLDYSVLQRYIVYSMSFLLVIFFNQLKAIIWIFAVLIITIIIITNYVIYCNCNKIFF